MKSSFLLILIILMSMVCLNCLERMKKKYSLSSSSSESTDLDSYDKSDLFFNYWEYWDRKYKKEERNKRRKERRKKKHKKYIWSDSSSYEYSHSKHYSYASSLIDFIGELKRKFAFVAMTSNPRNMVCSPIAALLPLGKLAFGAEDSTQRELLSAIGLTSSLQLHHQFQSIINNLQNIDGIHLDVASQLFLPRDKLLSSEYEEKILKTFGTSVKFFDQFNHSSAASSINSWVSEKTHSQIRSIISPADISDSVLIVNAVHFSGKWKHKFQYIQKDYFFTTDHMITRTMMTVTASFKYGKSKSLDCEVIRIPYVSEEAALYIYLPKQRTGLSLLVQQLNLAPDVANKVSMSERKLRLTIPKFTIQALIDLQAAYQEVGIHNIFSRDFGLKSMVKDETMVVHKALQKAVVEIANEEGSVETETPLHEYEGKSFIADHPFLFFVIAGKQQLFSGVFTG